MTVVNSTLPQLYLFHTLGCHLCDEAQALLTPMLQHFQLSWKKVDIADPPSETGFDAETLVEQWGVKIPVLYCTFYSANVQPASLQWPFTEEDVLQFLEQVFHENH